MFSGTNEKSQLKRDNEGFLIPRTPTKVYSQSSKKSQNLNLGDEEKELEDSFENLCLKARENLNLREIIKSTSGSPSTSSQNLPSFLTARENLSSSVSSANQLRSRTPAGENQEQRGSEATQSEDWLSVSIQTGRIKNLKPVLVKAGTRPVSGLKLIYKTIKKKSPLGLGGTFFWLEDAPEGYEWVLESSD